MTGAQHRQIFGDSRELAEVRAGGGISPRLVRRPKGLPPVEGSRFYANPVPTHVLETPCLWFGRVRAGGSRVRFLTSLQLTAIRFILYQCNALKPSRIVGRFREPPARQRLTNATVVCTISLGHGQRLKAALLHGWRPLRPSDESRLNPSVALTPGDLLPIFQLPTALFLRSGPRRRAMSYEHRSPDNRTHPSSRCLRHRGSE